MSQLNKRLHPAMDQYKFMFQTINQYIYIYITDNNPHQITDNNPHQITGTI